MSRLSTHVLDLTTGRPAVGVAVTLEVLNGSAWTRLATATTDEDGRVKDVMTPGQTAAKPPSPPLTSVPDAGIYRLSFETSAYFAQRGETCFYPQVIVTFEIQDAARPHHIPLLLSPFGYSTYRGS